MSNAGNLKATLTLEQAQFNAACRTASEQTRQFGETVAKAEKPLLALNAHMLTSRASLSTMAAVAGTSVGSLRHLAHAFEMFPGPVGLAIAAFISIKEIINSQAEAAKAAAERNEHLKEVMETVDEHLGKSRVWTGKAHEMDEDVKRLQKEIEKLEPLINTNAKLWEALGFVTDHSIDRNIARLRAEQWEAIEARNRYEEMAKEQEVEQERLAEAREKAAPKKDYFAEYAKTAKAAILDMMTDTEKLEEQLGKVRQAFHLVPENFGDKFPEIEARLKLRIEIAKDREWEEMLSSMDMPLEEKILEEKIKAQKQPTKAQASHIGEAVLVGMMGVYRAMHGGSGNPQLDEARKQTKLLERMVRTRPGPTS
jgi:hypothetical protein